MMTQTEITAEVFKIIRANEDKSAKYTMEKIREHLPDVTDDMLAIAISYVYERLR